MSPMFAHRFYTLQELHDKSEELREKLEDALRAQEELETEMEAILADADREEAERSILKNVVHRINIARGKAHKIQNEYLAAVKAATDAGAAAMSGDTDNFDNNADYDSYVDE